MRESEGQPHDLHSPAQRRRILGLGGLAVVVCLTLAAGGLAWAGFKSQVADSTGTFSAGTMLLRGTTPVGITCTSSSTVAPISSNSATCPGDPAPTGTVTTTASSVSDTLADSGTTSPTAASVSSPACGVEQLMDAASHDTALTMGGVTYGQGGPLSGTGVSLNGSNAWFESTSTYSTPSAFTLLAWFKAGSAATGTIFSISNSEFNGGATASDLNLWVNSSGKLVWGVVTLGALGAQVQSEVTSSSAVTNGSWHLAAATYSGLTSTLYLDGTSQGSALAVTGLASERGWYPSIGWGPVSSTSWAGPPTSNYFDGSLSMVSLSPSAASSAQISALAGEASTSNYESALSSDAPPSENWEMADAGTQAYTGTVNVSGGGTTTPCQRIEVTIQEVQGATTSCAVPAGSGSCPAPTSSTLLSSLSTAASLDAPTPTSSVQLTVTFELTNTSPAGVAGLNVLPDLDFGASRTSWSASLAYPDATAGL